MNPIEKLKNQAYDKKMKNRIAELLKEEVSNEDTKKVINNMTSEFLKEVKSGVVTFKEGAPTIRFEEFIKEIKKVNGRRNSS